ncbi:MAG: DUF3450 family protein [Gammaproteobacteria bacterium]
MNFPVRCFVKIYRYLSVVALLIFIPAVSLATTPNEIKPDAGKSNEQPPSPETIALLDARLNGLFNAAVNALKQQIDASPPFLMNEREARIQRLEKLPSANDSEQANKYRRLLEVYRIELDYGKTIETYQAELKFGEKTRLVSFLRVGRLALYYQTFDELESGIWSLHQHNWMKLPSNYDSTIAKGIRIARKLEPPQLLVLPLFGGDNENAPTLSQSETPPQNALEEIDHALANMEGLQAGLRENVINLKNFYQQQPPTQNSAEHIILFDRLLDNSHPTSLAELRELFDALLYRLNTQSGVTQFMAQVYAPNGIANEREVLNAGGFSLISTGRYLSYSINDGQLIELSRQPDEDILAFAQAYPQIDSQSLTTLAIDPSGGQILQLLVQVPTFKERVDQGGAVGYLIIILGSLAFIVSIYRFIRLALIGKKIQRQFKDAEFRLDNPLGRLLHRLDQTTLNDEEALYLIVEESLTTEQTRLEQGLSFLKLIAAIAPMLGLLGTVTGMIETFQSIALHGSGDPKLMSGGISEALVTTVAGLVTAIPILLLHSLLSGKSQNLAATLEAQISVALAHRLEHRNAIATTEQANL